MRREGDARCAAMQLRSAGGRGGAAGPGRGGGCYFGADLNAGGTSAGDGAEPHSVLDTRTAGAAGIELVGTLLAVPAGCASRESAHGHPDRAIGRPRAELSAAVFESLADGSEPRLGRAIAALLGAALHEAQCECRDGTEPQCECQWTHDESMFAHLQSSPETTKRVTATRSFASPSSC
jgi:hypothetical protein